MHNAPEMNEVERIFLIRDRKVSNGEIPTILAEEEFKKYKHNKTFPDKPPIKVQPFPQRASVIEGQTMGTGMFIPTPPTHVKRYCICGKQNDFRKYVQCESECEWYHPDCVGFENVEGLSFDDKQVKFVCPFCKPDVKHRLEAQVEKGQYIKIRSTKHKSEYFAYVPNPGGAEAQRSAKKKRTEDETMMA